MIQSSEVVDDVEIWAGAASRAGRLHGPSTPCSRPPPFQVTRGLDSQKVFTFCCPSRSSSFPSLVAGGNMYMS